MSETAEPLVTIGIPTYDRPQELERAARSALSQDYPHLEVLVSDDASTSQSVSAVASSLAAADPRLRYVRQQRNLGHAANYQWVLEAAAGEYFMWLADDDWIDPNYVSSCLTALRGDVNKAIVCGQARYYVDARHLIDERPIDLTSERPGVRLIRYFARVSVNGPLFGVGLRRDFLEVGFPEVVGGDWLFVAKLAMRGEVETLPATHIHRSASGLGSNAEDLARSFGLHGFSARHHHLSIAARMWVAIAFKDPWFQALKQPARLVVASVAYALIATRFTGIGLVRRLLGRTLSDWLERKISSWLRRVG